MLNLTDPSQPYAVSTLPAFRRDPSSAHIVGRFPSMEEARMAVGKNKRLGVFLVDPDGDLSSLPIWRLPRPVAEPFGYLCATPARPSSTNAEDPARWVVTFPCQPRGGAAPLTPGEVVEVSPDGAVVRLVEIAPGEVERDDLNIPLPW